MNLYEAIENGNLEKVKELILTKQKKNPEEFLSYINSYNNTFHITPLAISLREDQFKITLLLLENGAHPDRYYKHKNTTGYSAILTPFLLKRDKSVSKLLILYGATIPNIEFNKKREAIKAFAYEIQLLANEQKKKLDEASEDEIKTDFASAFLNFKEAAAIWQAMSLDEPNLDFKLHYQKKALLYYRNSMACYIKITDIQQQSHHQSEYENIVSLQRDLQAEIEENRAALELLQPIDSDNEKTGNFFVKLGNSLRRLVCHRGEPTADATVLKSLLFETHNVVHNRNSLK